jgi:uncharacterized protein YegL
MAEGMVRERLNVYFLLDTSSTMAGEKIEQLNTFMQEVKPVLEESSIDHDVEIVIRVIEFGNDGVATWHEGNADTGIPVERWIWTNLQARGATKPIADAIEMVADALENSEYRRNTFSSVILITDATGIENDSKFKSACNELAKKRNWNVCPHYGRSALIIGGESPAPLEIFVSKCYSYDKGQNSPLVFYSADEFIANITDCIMPPHLGDCTGCYDTSVKATVSYISNAPQRSITQSLQAIKKNHGEDVFADINRFESLVRDNVTGSDLERMRKCLIAAMGINSYERLRIANDGGNIEREISILVDILYNQNGLDASLAKEAVECIAELFIDVDDNGWGDVIPELVDPDWI